jgi:hypothetical protein
VCVCMYVYVQLVRVCLVVCVCLVLCGCSDWVWVMREGMVYGWRSENVSIRRDQWQMCVENVSGRRKKKLFERVSRGFGVVRSLGRLGG